MSVTGQPLNLKNPPPSPKYKCSICEAEDFPIMLLNTFVSLKYAVKNQGGELSTLRTIVGCGNCRSVISIQFLPVELPADVGTPPPPRSIYMPGNDA